MPRQKRTDDAVKPDISTKYPKVVWCRYELNEEEYQGLKTLLLESQDATAKCLDSMTQQKYKVNIDYDYENKCFTAYAFPIGDQHRNAGMAMSGHGRSASKAVCELYWKYYMQGGTWMKPEKSAKGGMWDDDLVGV